MMAPLIFVPVLFASFSWKCMKSRARSFIGFIVPAVADCHMLVHFHFISCINVNFRELYICVDCECT